MSLWVLAFIATTANAQSPRVVLGEVERGPLIEEIALNGTVAAQRNVEISVSIAGLVRERVVDIGTQVSRGDLLLRLDDELPRLEHERSKAEVREAEKRLTEAQRLLEQARSVSGGRVIPATEQARRSSEVGIAEAALGRTRAAERLQAARLRRHALHAPFDAIVSARAADVGQWLEPGDSVFTLVDTADLLLNFQVPQQAFRLLGPNAVLSVDLPGTGKRPAAISTWLPVTDVQARTFLLRARPPADSKLVPGMAVSATLQLVLSEEALSVARDAINRYPDGRVTVWVAEPAGDKGLHRVREQLVRVGGSAGGMVFITEGLTGRESVVTRGNEALRDGLEVNTAGG
ncbi:MAG: efflux RND transporter periplasmic adaptor subunit [Azoarcus sp.]|nr:efflux RND transporter periplasmic adaptor subunit [Azoarcus sp.]